eukprot:gnl/TRDRNA2_/TRDRNA2_188381_c0_seq1.p1 gnl/TRDRNA2_/TRDRNA2_188381_c0~~gnl/TRDRNA2_/TRDRNA2_188381_c0_seq1.p1  ORF type:complete len:272 (-),score=44.63 gnl/TRDRNA2_/TRDRNA2_188381_c0_seq1:100-915(-)
MIGPRRGIVARSGTQSSRAPAPVQSTRARPRSRSRSNASDDSDKKDKAFAWMDSGDESESESKNAPKPVPLDKVERIGQMAQLAPSLEKRLKRGEVRERELCEIAAALNRSKFFDGGLFEQLSKELERAFRKRRLGHQDAMKVLCWLAEMNAYNAEMFSAACAVLEPELSSFPEPEQRRVEAALKGVNHLSQSFASALKGARRVDKREACPLFWKGQCKWGPKCKLSHDQDNFESTVQDGRWQAANSLKNKTQGFMQSADMYKADRCGALW